MGSASPASTAHVTSSLTLVEGTEHIAKLSVSTDARVIESMGRDVLLIERFDRLSGGQRRHVVSGLTMLGLDALLGARYGSYPEMLDVLRERALAPQAVGRRLFERIVFTIAIGNNDAHARNHAAFWDGHSLELTPVFDLTPTSARSFRPYAARPYREELVCPQRTTRGKERA